MRRVVSVLGPVALVVGITGAPLTAQAQDLLRRVQISPSPPPIPLPNLSNLFPDPVSMPDAIFQLIVNILLLIGGIAAFFYIIYGGFQYVMAGSNAGQADQGKKNIISAIIGVVIMGLAYVLMIYVRNAIVAALRG